MMVEAFADQETIDLLGDDHFKKIHSIHSIPWQAWRQKKDGLADIRVAIVRDPVARAVSGYRDRVLRRNDLDVDKAHLPSWSDFLKSFHRYTSKNFLMRHHFLPITNFLGDAPEFFTHIFRIDQIGGPFMDLLRDLSGREMKERKVNASIEHADQAELKIVGMDDEEFLQYYYWCDYRAYGPYFQG